MAKVLVVEDETSLLDVYAEVLTSEGHEVMKASDGDTGLKLALENEWSVMFLDIMLPGLDGIALLTQLNKSQRMAGRYVIVLSNLDNPSIVSECLKLGAVESLNKADITPESITSIVAKYIVAPSRDSK